LENTIERAVVLANRDTIGAEALTGLSTSGARETDRSGRDGTLRESIAAAEERAIREALRAAGGNRAAAARRLDVSLRTLYYKLKTIGLE
jgi:DNA-binding NtrC family response regulator